MTQLSFLLAALAAAAAAEPPQISLQYATPFEAACARAVKAPVLPETEAELAARLPELEAAWRRQGPALLEAASEVVGRPYAFREARAGLHTCRGVPSTSIPLAINLRRFLTTTYGAEAEPAEHFVDTVFHEVLHRYMDDLLGDPGQMQQRSALLRKHAAESQVVKNHLHLLALQAVVYRRLGRGQLLATVRPATAALAPPYARAWEIVDAEGPEAFVAELRALRP